MSPDYYCMDGTIPRRELPRVLEASPRCPAEYGLPVANVFHAGDGNMHPLILFDANRPGELDRAEAPRRQDPRAVRRGAAASRARARRRPREINQMCVQFNADEITFFHAVKAAFDPQGLLNPARTFRRCTAAQVGAMRPSRQAAVFRTGALLMRREIESIDDSAALVAQVDAAIHDRQPLHPRCRYESVPRPPGRSRTLDVRARSMCARIAASCRTT